MLTVLALLAVVLLAGVYFWPYGGSTGAATALFLAGSVVVCLFVWELMTHVHPAPYWRPASAYIRPGWDKPM